MAIISGHHPVAFIFGLLGNIVSLMVLLAPLPTFYRVYKKKNTQGFQSIPYVVALFSAMLWLYYALIKTNGSMLLTINSVGCTIESTYIIIYLIYAPREAKIFTIKLLVLLNVSAYGAILLFTLLFAEGARRVTIVGWICSVFAVSVFAAPLSIMRLVIRTKSVEFMPISLSFFLTLAGVIWFVYGLLTKDLYVACPNVLGFAFGIAQMTLYMIYKNAKTNVVSETKQQEVVLDIDLSIKDDKTSQTNGADPPEQLPKNQKLKEPNDYNV